MADPQNSNLRVFPHSATLNLSPSIKSQNVGSATGNPRNKCALKPGHSLMDWIRLGNSGVDLSGTQGKISPVSSTELSKHCTQNDAWMAIRGNVYNVTRYMDFHPGGHEELMRGIGKDATKLFDEVHAWVNYEQLLKKCLIGPLRNVFNLDVSFLKPTNKHLPPPTPGPIKTIPTEIIPRFDWIQKRSNITLYFYTKQFCNPGLVLKKNDNETLTVKILIKTKCHTYNLELYKAIKWPPISLKTLSESGKIELNFTKEEMDLWPNYGKSKYSAYELLEDQFYEVQIIKKQKLNHNSFALLLKGDVAMGIPLGHHLTLSCCIDGQEVHRSYTPIPKKYSFIEEGSNFDLYFLIKTYEDGFLAKYINRLEIGAELHASQSKGNFLLNKLLDHTRIAFLAAGSGITPFLGLLDHLLARNSKKIENIMLILFNKTEDDIWCRTELENLSKEDERFHIKHILSQSGDDWCGDKGSLSTDVVSMLKNRTSTSYSTFICVCGPPGFNSSAGTILKSLDFCEETIHLFNG